MTRMTTFPRVSDRCDHAIRRAEPRDAAACTAMVQGWLSAARWVPDIPAGQIAGQRIAAAIRAGRILVHGDPAVAFLSLDEDHDEIRGLFSAIPGAGHGTILLDAAKRGRDFLQFTAPLVSPPVQTFFRSQGFLPVGSHAPMADYPIAGLRMEWWSSP